MRKSRQNGQVGEISKNRRIEKEKQILKSEASFYVFSLSMQSPFNWSSVERGDSCNYNIVCVVCFGMDKYFGNRNGSRHNIVFSI